MPELPEVETMRRGLECVVGRRITAAEFPRSRVRPISVSPQPARLAARLVGRTITAAQRRGKRVILELRAGGEVEPLWLVIEPRMTGLMLVTDPPTVEHERLVLRLAGPRRPAVVRFWDRRGLGTIRLLDAASLERACGAAKLGPDGLEVSAEQLTERLGHSRRAVKVALLDQRAVAGIGNIYAAEILFRAAIDPRSVCRRLRQDDWHRIAVATRDVLAEAVRCEGSSIGDETYRTTDNRIGQFQLRHRVYGRAGQNCSRCGATIVRMVQAQRATFFCGGCQRRAGARARAGGQAPARGRG